MGSGVLRGYEMGSGVFRAYEMGTLTGNGLRIIDEHDTFLLIKTSNFKLNRFET